MKTSCTINSLSLKWKANHIKLSIVCLYVDIFSKFSTVRESIASCDVNLFNSASKQCHFLKQLFQDTDVGITAQRSQLCTAFMYFSMFLNSRSLINACLIMYNYDSFRLIIVISSLSRFIFVGGLALALIKDLLLLQKANHFRRRTGRH